MSSSSVRRLIAFVVVRLHLCLGHSRLPRRAPDPPTTVNMVCSGMRRTQLRRRYGYLSSILLLACRQLHSIIMFSSSRADLRKKSVCAGGQTTLHRIGHLYLGLPSGLPTTTPYQLARTEHESITLNCCRSGSPPAPHLGPVSCSKRSHWSHMCHAAISKSISSLGRQ